MLLKLNNKGELWPLLIKRICYRDLNNRFDNSNENIYNHTYIKKNDIYPKITHQTSLENNHMKKKKYIMM